jgi:hypothetical protein
MKSSARANFLLQIGSGLLLLGIFAKPLGIPSDFEIIIELVALIVLSWGVVGIIKAKKAGQIPTISASKKRSKFWILVATYSVACLSMPFLLPLTGVSLPFDKLLVLSVITFFICVGITYFTIKLQK